MFDVMQAKFLENRDEYVTRYERYSTTEKFMEFWFLLAAAQAKGGADREFMLIATAQYVVNNPPHWQVPWMLAEYIMADAAKVGTLAEFIASEMNSSKAGWLQ